MGDPHTATLVRELEELDNELSARSRELARRDTNGVRVTLMYDPVSEVHPLWVEVDDGKVRESWPVPADRGNDAFEHPWAYAP